MNTQTQALSSRPRIHQLSLETELQNILKGRCPALVQEQDTGRLICWYRYNCSNPNTREDCEDYHRHVARVGGAR